MKALDETEKLVMELQNRIQVVLRPSVPSAAKMCGDEKSVPAPACSPMVDGVTARAFQIETTNATLRDIISRVEL